MKRIIILMSFLCACVFAIYGVVLSTFSTASQSMLKQETMILQIIVLAVTLGLMLVVESTLVKDARSAVKQFHKKDVTSSLTERIFKLGRYLNISGLIITFLWLINQIFAVRVMPLKCSIAVISVGIILYAVGIVAVLLISPAVFKEDPI